MPPLPESRRSTAPKTPTADQACVNCAWARTSEARDGRTLECRYDPPRPIEGWPRVLRVDWCRRWAVVPAAPAKTELA